MQQYLKFYNHYIDKSLHKFICEDLKNEKIAIDEIFFEKLSNIITNIIY